MRYRSMLGIEDSLEQPSPYKDVPTFASGEALGSSIGDDYMSTPQDGPDRCPTCTRAVHPYELERIGDPHKSCAQALAAAEQERDRLREALEGTAYNLEAAGFTAVAATTRKMVAEASPSLRASTPDKADDVGLRLYEAEASLKVWVARYEPTTNPAGSSFLSCSECRRSGPAGASKQDIAWHASDCRWATSRRVLASLPAEEREA